MSLSSKAVAKPTTILIIFIVLTALGLYSTSKLPIDLYPDLEIPYIIVSTSYPNAGPEEVENSITRTLESSLSGITGLKTLRSTSSSGSSMVMLELNYGTNLDAATNEIRDRLDLVKDYLPEDSTTPTIIKMDPSMLPIMQLSVTGNRTPEELREYAEEIIQPRLEQIDGVASANIMGGRERAIKVEIPRDRLEAYSLTITQIAQMIGAQNMQASGGTISEGDLNYTITTVGEYKTLDDIRNTVKILKKNKIKIYNYFVIGLPWETEKTVEETIKFAIELDSNFISFYTATPLPGTRYFAYAMMNNLVTETLDFSSAYYFPAVRSHELSKERIFELHKLAVKRFYLRPKFIIKTLLGLRSFNEFKNYFIAGINLILKK